MLEQKVYENSKKDELDIIPNTQITENGLFQLGYQLVKCFDRSRERISEWHHTLVYYF